MNTFDRTVKSLCNEIDELKCEVEYWQSLYEQEKADNIRKDKENMDRLNADLGRTIALAFSFKDSEIGDLVIPAEKRKDLAQLYKE